MLQLPEKPFGRGLHRLCFAHPEDSAKCVKIVHCASQNAGKELAREIAYYKRLQSTLKDWTSIPKYFGEVQTNLGTGHVYERILNEDGSATRTLEDVLRAGPGPSERQELRDALERLRGYLFANNIVTMTIKTYNILCRRTAGRIDLVLCDNLGEANLLPLATYCPLFCKGKLYRRWKTFCRVPEVAELLSRHSGNPRA